LGIVGLPPIGVLAQSSDVDVGAAGSVETQDVREVVTAMLQRRSAVTSGKFEVVWQSGSTLPGGKEVPEGIHHRCTVLFEHDNWKIDRRHGRIKDKLGVASRVNGYCFTLMPTIRGEAEWADFSLKVSAASPFPGIGNRPVGRIGLHPRHCGSIWDIETVDYLEEEVDRVEIEGRHTEHGVEVIHLSLSVPKEDAGKPFGSVNPRTFAGGSLHIHVVPEWGYVVPLVEYRSTKSVPGLQIVSKGFSKQGEFYFPRWISRKSMSTSSPGTYHSVEFLDVTSLNEHFVNRDLSILTPKNTRIVVDIER
jgi:hypothetical protein